MKPNDLLRLHRKALAARKWAYQDLELDTALSYRQVQLANRRLNKLQRKYHGISSSL